MRSITFFILALLTVLAFQAGNVWAGPQSDQGLELVRFTVDAGPEPNIGSRAEITFVLKNNSQEPIVFHEKYGIFVGARWSKGTSKVLNRDFGYQYQGWRLRPGQSIHYNATQILDMPGDWTFWPAFNVNGQWGPFDSEKQLVRVASPAPRPESKGGGGETIVPWQGQHLTLQVFPKNNPWNQVVENLPRHPDSDTYIASIGANKNLHPDFGSGKKWKVMGYALRQNHEFGIPFVVIRKGQPLVPVEFKWKRESDPGPYPIPMDAPMEAAGDRHVIVIDYDGMKLYELFAAERTAIGWKAAAGAVFDLTSNKLRPMGWTSADAAGLPIFPGLVRYEEVFKKGEINHALRFTVRRTRRAYILPATHYASKSQNPAFPPMGLRLRLRADFDIEPFPEPVKVILRALKKYGMILADNGGDWFISGAPHPEWDDDQISWLKKVKGRDMEVVYTGEPITR